MARFNHNGVIYEELPDGNVRVVGYAQQSAASPGLVVPSNPALATRQAADDARKSAAERRDDVRLNLAIADRDKPASGYRWADAAHTKQEIIPGGPADTSGDTGAGGMSEQATVKALVEGRMAFPSGAALRAPYWQNMLAKVAQADPTFDAVNYSARAATRKDFTSGVAARNITAFNTALGHLGTLWEAGRNLDNGSFKPWNALANATQREFGDPRVDTFNAARQAAVDELEKAFRGSNGTQAGIDEWKHSINSAQSPAQLRAVIGQMVDLLGSRINAMGEQYKTGMGRMIDGITLLDPHAQAVFNALAPGGSGRIENAPPAHNNPLEGGSGRGGGPTPGGGAGRNQPGLTPGGGGDRTFYTERDQAVADEAQRAFLAGASRAEIDAIAAKYGRQPFGPDLDRALESRARGNVGVQFAPTPSGREERGLTGAVADAVGSNVGSFATGVGNAVTVGQLGRIAKATGGSEGGTDLAMDLTHQNALPYIVGEVGGSILPTMGIARGMRAGAAAIESPFAQAALRSPMAADVAYGGAYGAGTSDDPVRGAVAGALLAGTGSYGASRIGAKVAGLRTSRIAEALTRGEGAVLNAVNKTGRDAVVEALTKADNMGSPATLADVSPEVNSLTGAAIRRSPTVAGKARDTLIPRGRGQYDRMVAALGRDLGPVENIPQRSEDLIGSARAQAGPLYDAAYAAPAVGSPEIDSLLATPFGRDAIGRARTIAANERRDPMALGFALDADGKVVLNPVNVTLHENAAAARSTFDANSMAARMNYQRGVTAAEAELAEASAVLDRQRRLAAGGAARPADMAAAQQAVANAERKLGDRRAAMGGMLKASEARGGVEAAEAALAAQPAPGVAAVSPQYTTQTLDYAKRGMDDVLEQYRSPVTGKLVLDEAGRAQDGVRRQFLREVDTLNPAYRDARAVYAGPAAEKDALLMGQDAATLSPDQLGLNMARATPLQVDQMRLGFQSQLAENAGRLRYSTNPFESVLGTPAMEQRIGTLYGETDGTARLLAHRDLERDMAASSNRLIGNSMTAERRVADEAFAPSPLVEGALHAGAAVATHGASIPGTAARMAGVGIRDRIALGLGRRAEEMAGEIAPIALDTNPQATIARLLAIEQKQADYGIARLLLEKEGARKGGRVGASVSSALIPYAGQ